MPRRKKSYYKRLEIADKGCKSAAESRKKKSYQCIVPRTSSKSDTDKEALPPTLTSSKKRKSHFQKTSETVSERKRIIVYEDVFSNMLTKFTCKQCYRLNHTHKSSVMFVVVFSVV